MDLINQAKSIVTNPRNTKWTAPLQLFGDAVLTGLIVWKIPYTEIDWKAYMQQIQIYLNGERDYAKIHGDTGPLVYPAAHVYIYRALYALTNSGQDIYKAQIIFVGVYLLTLLFVLQCYRQAGAPPWVLPLLSLSKRMHSIFVLRLFNDCFAVLLLWVAIWCYQKKFWTIGTLSYAFGVGVKMSLLLALPAIGLVLWQGMGRDRAFYQAQVIAQLQLLLAYPFIVGNWKSYLARAFELSRTFMFKWTVNWRFVGEETFLGKPFSRFLIACHLALLGAFGAGRWLAPSGWSVPMAFSKLFSPPSQDEQMRISRRVSPSFVLTAILTAMTIGCACARSLHYQFFVYIAWSTPFLMWKSGMHWAFVYAVCIVQEWAWNVYPSTNTSSVMVVESLMFTLFCAWIGTIPETTAKRGEPEKPTVQQPHKHAE